MGPRNAAPRAWARAQVRSQEASSLTEKSSTLGEPSWEGRSEKLEEIQLYKKINFERRSFYTWGEQGFRKQSMTVYLEVISVLMLRFSF